MRLILIKWGIYGFGRIKGNIMGLVFDVEESRISVDIEGYT